MSKPQKVHYKWVYLKNRLEHEKEVSPFKVKDRFGDFKGEAWYYFKVGTGKERFCYMYTIEEHMQELLVCRKKIDEQLVECLVKSISPFDLY
jgi:hypothetical protein